MVTAFIIEPEALIAGESALADLIADDERLFEAWKLYGALYLNEDDKEFDAALNHLPLKRRKNWTAMMGSSLLRKVATKFYCSFSAVESPEDLSRVCNDINVACLEETRALVFGLGEEDLCHHTTSGIEICRIHHFDRSCSVKNIRSMWSKQIYSGSSREEIWNNRFRSLAYYASSITIVDRYCVGNAYNAFSSHKTSGLQHFLKLVGSVGGPRKKAINIFSSTIEVNASDAKDICIKICQSNSMNSIGSVHLHMVNDKVFQKIAHDRFLKFGPIVTGIGRGVSMFENEVCNESYGCSLTCDEDSAFESNVVKELRNESDYTKLR